MKEYKKFFFLNATNNTKTIFTNLHTFLWLAKSQAKIGILDFTCMLNKSIIFKWNTDGNNYFQYV